MEMDDRDIKEKQAHPLILPDSTRASWEEEKEREKETACESVNLSHTTHQSVFESNS